MDTPSIDPLAFPDDYDLTPREHPPQASEHICRCRPRWTADTTGCPMHGGSRRRPPIDTPTESA